MAVSQSSDGQTEENTDSGIGQKCVGEKIRPQHRHCSFKLSSLTSFCPSMFLPQIKMLMRALIGQKNEAPSSRLVLRNRLSHISFFCPANFLPNLPLLPIRLNVTHPDTMFTHKIDSNAVFARNR